MDHKASFWRKTKKWAVVIMVLPLLFSIPVVGSGFEVNRHQEYCTYVLEGEAYHVEVLGDPCRFTLENIFNISIPFLLLGALTQTVFWFFVWINYRALSRRLS